MSTYASRLYSIIVDSGQAYRQNDCFKLCQQEQIIAKCGCYNLEFSMFNNQTMPCLNLTQFNCLDNEKSNFDLTECQANLCPLECDSIKYDLSLSSLIKPTVNDYRDLNISQTISYEEWRTQQLQIFVYYPQLEYTLIEEIPAMTIIDLISNIGGSMGLIVSVSFFTILEIGELIFLLLSTYFQIENFSTFVTGY